MCWQRINQKIRQCSITVLINLSFDQSKSFDQVQSILQKVLKTARNIVINVMNE